MSRLAIKLSQIITTKHAVTPNENFILEITKKIAGVISPTPENTDLRPTSLVRNEIIPNCHYKRPWAHKTSYAMGPGGSYPRGNAVCCDDDHSRQFSPEVKNAWNYNSIPPIRFHGVVPDYALCHYKCSLVGAGIAQWYSAGMECECMSWIQLAEDSVHGGLL
jgi:hypothetical protein